MKKIISLFLVLVTILSVSATAVSAEDTAITGKCGDNITYTYEEKTETLYIEGTGKMYDYSTDKHEQPECFKIAKNIVISDGVTHIGMMSFAYACAETIKIGNSVRIIDDKAFLYNSSLINLVIPDSVETIGNTAFYGCYGLKNVTIGKSVKSIGNLAFVTSETAPDNLRITVPENVTKFGKNVFGVNHSNANDDPNKRELMTNREDYIVVGKVGSPVYEYCQKNGVTFDDVDGCEAGTHIWGGQQVVETKKCGKNDGIYAKQCIKCGSRRYDFATKNEHDLVSSTRKIIKKANFFEEGEVKKYCTTCKKYIKYTTEKKYLPNPTFEAKVVNKNQVKINITKKSKYVTYYIVEVNSTDKYGGRKEVVQTHTLKDGKKKLTIKNLKKNKKYIIDVTVVYEKNGKTATRGSYNSIKTKK